MDKIHIILFCGFISTCMVFADNNCKLIANETFEICKRSEILESVSEIFDPITTKTWPQSLYIDDKEISAIAPGAFKSLTIIQLIIKFKDTYLHLEKESFSGLSMLESLQITSGIVVLQTDLFIKINKIEFLTLKIDGYEETPVHAFPELTRLTSIAFVESNFRVLDTSTFYRFSSKILSLRLSSNEIAKVEGGSFFNMYRLKLLQFTGNNIQEIEPEAFLGLHDLEELSIVAENIYEIKKNVFCKLESLKILTIILSNVEKIRAGAFKGLDLESLDLTNNQLSTINSKSFFGLQTKSLDLSNNPIMIIGHDAFKKSRIQQFYLKNINMTDYDIHRWGLRTSTKIVLT